MNLFMAHRKYRCHPNSKVLLCVHQWLLGEYSVGRIQFGTGGGRQVALQKWIVCASHPAIFGISKLNYRAVKICKATNFPPSTEF